MVIQTLPVWQNYRFVWPVGLNYTAVWLFFFIQKKNVFIVETSQWWFMYVMEAILVIYMRGLWIMKKLLY